MTAVEVWRGMTGMSSKWLKKFADVDTDTLRFGHVRVDRRVKISQMRWWSIRPGFAMAYASTDLDDSTHGFDVLLKGTTDYDGDSMRELTHALKHEGDRIVNVTDVYFSVPTGDRRAMMLSLIEEADMRHDRIKKLTEYVVLEEDFGGDGGGDWGGWDSGDYGGYGYGGSGGASLYSTFIQPFVDVLDTAASVVETGMSKLQLLTGIATYGIMSVMIPYIKPKYDAMIEHDKRRLAAIHRKHEEVFKRTDQALTEVGGNYDGVGVFFALFPDAVISKNIVKLAASGSETALKTAADTLFDLVDAVTFNLTGPATDAIRKHFNFQESVVGSGVMLTEADADGEKVAAEKLAKMVLKVMKSPKVKKAFHDSEQMSSLRDDALDALSETVKMAVEPIQALKRVKSVADLKAVTGHDVDIAGAFKKKQVDPKQLHIDDAEVDAAVRDALPGLVKQAAAPFVKRLKHLRDDLKALESAYDVAGSDVAKRIDKIFSDALTALG